MRKTILAATTALAAIVPVAASAAVSWVPWHGAVPPGAVEGGFENGLPLFVCRAPYNGGVHPGKIVAGRCNISWGGREIVVAGFEVAVGAGHWGLAADPAPANALVGGEENGHPLLVCKANLVLDGVDRGFHSGKVVNGRCNFGWGGVERTVAPYDLFYQDAAAAMTAPPPPALAATPSIAPDTQIEIESAKGKIPLKPEEKIALMFLTAIQQVEFYCNFGGHDACPMASFLPGVAQTGHEPKSRLRFDPAADPNYHYTMRVSGAAWEAHADPVKPGLAGFYFYSKGIGGPDAFYNPTGPASLMDTKLMGRSIMGDGFDQR